MFSLFFRLSDTLGARGSSSIGPEVRPQRRAMDLLLQVAGSSSIVRKASEIPRLTARSLQKILADAGVAVHCSDMKRYLYKYGLHGRVIRAKPLLSPHHKNHCVKLANEHRDKPDVFWKQDLWTDEAKLELFGRNDQRYVWRRKGTDLNEKNLCPTVKYEFGSILLWGCIASRDTGNISRVEGKADSIKFQEILDANLMTSVKKLKVK